MAKVVDGLISVIIPTFNRAALCKRAVESVLAQSYRDVEVIVVDDGSGDNTRQALEGLDNRIRYLWQQNSGVAVARNLGIESATGEYIAFLDSDDTWLPWKLEAQLAVLQAFPSAGMVFTDMMAVGDDEGTIYESYKARMFGAYEYFRPERDFRESKAMDAVWSHCPPALFGRQCYVGNIFQWMFRGNLILTSSVLLCRDRQRAIGLFDVELYKSGEDYDFHFRGCSFGDVAYMDLSSVRYRVGASDQLTSNDMLIWIARNDLKTLTKMLSGGFVQPPLSLSAIRKRVAESYGWVGREEFSLGSHYSTKYLWKSLRLSPLQPRVAALCLLSVLPRRATLFLKSIKEKVASGSRSA